MSAEFACAACRTPFLTPHPLDAQTGLCLMCGQGLCAYEGAYSYGFYEGALRRLIHLYKFDRVETLARPLGRYLARALPRDGEAFDVLVPMPLHWRRRWARGFNQSALLAREAARHLGLPVAEGALRRIRHAPPQSGLTSAARRRNVSGLFTVPPSASAEVRGRRVLLVDDVLTTGATARAAASALKRGGGAAQVSVLTLARADRREQFGGLLREQRESAGYKTKGAAG
ncbi:MAG: ComF family protein [Bryobacterales bacterium]|nr:ComF family protein [Bryobacterales bacterium]